MGIKIFMVGALMLAVPMVITSIVIPAVATGIVLCIGAGMVLLNK